MIYQLALAIVLSGLPSLTPSPNAISSSSLPIETGQMTVSWNPPLTNADGSELNDLGGYKIYYGTSSGNYTNVIAVNDSLATKYTIKNMPLKTYFVAVSAVDLSGNESNTSVEVSKTLK
jgi:hypothetical protein